MEIIKEIITKFDLKIEIGGGIRNFESIQKYTDAGVEKVILGSAAIKDKNFLKEADHDAFIFANCLPFCKLRCSYDHSYSPSQ